MTIRATVWAGALCAFLAIGAGDASAQVFEAVGSRALGMGGAFVAVATDSSATWWNPGAVADGPFMDMAVARAMSERVDRAPGARERASWWAFATPVVGISYYRLRLTDIRADDPTVEASAGRQEGTAGLPIRTLSVSQLGATIVHTVLPGIHAGATIKYVRGTARGAAVAADDATGTSGLLDRGEALDGGDAESRVGLDIGVLATAGPVRLGATVRNLRESEFGGGAWRLPRQIRVGAAFDVEKLGGIPLTLAGDADVQAYDTAAGPRQVVAVGVEQWLIGRRLGLRAGARANRVGIRGRAVTGGVSISLRKGSYLDGHVVRGGSPGERGWGAAARVSF